MIETTQTPAATLASPKLASLNAGKAVRSAVLDRKSDEILPHELPHALDHAPKDVTTLSLDCFDTLLWRDCHAPSDVFADLPDLLLRQRAGGEAKARRIMRTHKRRNEVSLGEIYTQALPNADEPARKAAIAAELEAEARACFAFAPTVELMMDAKARGLEIIIVSDTYLSAEQLRNLIAAAVGEEVAGLIDRVFASSDAGVSKGEGLLGKALKAMKRRAHQALHIGDNRAADYESARALGIRALHLVQFDERAKRRLRFERMCQQMSGSNSGSSPSRLIGLQPHRALLAKYEPQITDAAEALGFTVLGPIFAAFDRWLREQAEELQEAHGGTVHWLFMLRDGHLPHLVHQAGPSQNQAKSQGRVEISRFVATAASLTTREAYVRHVGLEHGLNPSTLARQMLLSEEEIERVIGSPSTDSELSQASERLLNELRKGQRQKITRRRARAMADGLMEHVRAAVDPQPGDTLMLVDLGYDGSAQNAIDALLTEELGVRVAGRYLICRERSATGLDKSGLIDASHFDAGVLEAICANVAVIEQLATCELGSVIGYDENGAALRRSPSVKGAQSAVRERVQAGAERFVRAAGANPIIRTRDVHASAAWRDCASQVLLRFLFLPDRTELNTLRSFEHDVNLGSERMVALFDQEDASEQLKRRGLFYMKGSSRMFLPADLAEEDMTTRLALMAQMRFGLGLTYADYTVRSLDLTSFHIGEGDEAVSMISANPTHDGYYVARIPVRPSDKAVALQLGAACEWVELASVARSRLASLTGEREDEAARPCRAVTYDRMDELSPGLLRCLDETALVMVMPEWAVDEAPGPQMIEIAFRPIRRREASTQQGPSATNASMETAA